MLNEPTTEKLKKLNLYAMANAWTAQRSDVAMGDLDFDVRFGMLVDAETLARDNKRIARLLREAKLRIPTACVEDIDVAAKRDIDRTQIRTLSSGRWIADHQNVLITGMTGVGKTYLACALGQLACRTGFRALYRRASRLFDELALARADGSYTRVLARIAKVDVLIIDDWALSPLSDLQRRDILEVIEDRYALRSTILVSQLPVEKWHDHLADPTIADAVLDRLVHNAHRLAPRGQPGGRRRARRSEDPDGPASLRSDVITMADRPGHDPAFRAITMSGICNARRPGSQGRRLPWHGSSVTAASTPLLAGAAR